MDRQQTLNTYCKCTARLLYKMVLGSKMINRFGWAIVSFLTLVMTLFTANSFTLSWWNIDYTGSCSNFYVVVMLRYGVCEARESQHPEDSNSRCIQWYEDSDWEDVDEVSGSDTSHAHTYTYPTILILSYACEAVLVLQLFICLYQWRQLIKVMWLQRAVLLLTASFMAMEAYIYSVGSDTSVTNPDTWSFTNSCSSKSSYPGFGAYMPAAAAYIGWAVLFILNFPEKCCCFHLTRSDQALRSDKVPDVVSNIMIVNEESREKDSDAGVPYECSIKYGDAASPDIISSKVLSGRSVSSETEMVSSPSSAK